ncbi:MAG: TlpA disulfide reductase family protein [Mariprofundaceae bacterium]
MKKNPFYLENRTVLKIFIMIILLFLSACSDEANGKSRIAGIGDEFPDVTLMSISGEQVASKALFADKVVVLNLWATWCPPCRKEMPDLVKLSTLLPKDQYMVVGIAADHNLNDVQSYVSEKGVSFPIYWDPSGGVIAGPLLGTYRYPETFVINRKGVIVEKVVGAFPWADEKIISLLKEVHATGKVAAPS